jgi:hypothetical protein
MTRNKFDKTNYIITAGWWCGVAENEVRKRQGSEKTREGDFFSKWKKSILDNTNPKKIMVLDSASTTLPTDEQLEGVEFISLLNNPGHSTHHEGHYSGYMRSIIMGLTYASMCDADYWVYIEQDVLLKGKGVIEHCIENMTTPYMFGTGQGSPQFLQQSLIIIRKDGIFNFLKYLNKISAKDKEISPESKFLIASSLFYRLIPEFFYRQITKRNWIGKYTKKFIFATIGFAKGYDECPIGYGRTRPIDFSQPYYYFQHGSDEELVKHFRES